jgi:3-deoxy-D-manno-octulosonic-acid transferase
MRFVLDFIYLTGLVFMSPWFVVRAIRTGGWRDAWTRLGFVDAPLHAIWLHGSSVGEVRLLEPLIRRLETEGFPLAVSSCTMTGVEAARRSYPGHAVFRFPFDFSFVQRRLMARLDPQLVVIVESDLWPNHLLSAERLSVPVAIVNAKLSERSLRLHRWSRLIPRALRNVAVVAAQTRGHADRFVALGTPEDRIHVTGNMKYDLTTDQDGATQRGELRRRLGYSDDACVVIGGSLHPREDEDLVAAFSTLAKASRETRLIIVPRYPDQAPVVVRNLARSGYPAVSKSELDADPDRVVSREEVVVVDTLGELRRCYAASDVAFVGGSLYFRGSNKGGHNLMEPAVLGLPVIFGPHNFSFRETVADLLAAGAGIEVRDRAELASALAGLVESKEGRVETGRRARRVIDAGRGASERNYELLMAALDSEAGCSSHAQQAQCRHPHQTQAVNE